MPDMRPQKTRRQVAKEIAAFNRKCPVGTRVLVALPQIAGAPLQAKTSSEARLLCGFGVVDLEGAGRHCPIEFVTPLEL